MSCFLFKKGTFHKCRMLSFAVYGTNASLGEHVMSPVTYSRKLRYFDIILKDEEFEELVEKYRKRSIKFFKNSVNFELSEFNFHFSNELNIFQYKFTYDGVEIFVQVYFIMTFISDLLIILCFFIIYFVIDVRMVIKLRKT